MAQEVDDHRMAVWHMKSSWARLCLFDTLTPRYMVKHVLEHDADWDGRCGHRDLFQLDNCSFYYHSSFCRVRDVIASGPGPRASSEARRLK